MYLLNKRSERSQNDKGLKKTQDDFVLPNAEKNWVCVSDTDRQTHQRVSNFYSPITSVFFYLIDKTKRLIYFMAQISAISEMRLRTV